MKLSWHQPLQRSLHAHRKRKAQPIWRIGAGESYSVTPVMKTPAILTAPGIASKASWLAISPPLAHIARVADEEEKKRRERRK